MEASHNRVPAISDLVLGSSCTGVLSSVRPSVRPYSPGWLEPGGGLGRLWETPHATNCPYMCASTASWYDEAVNYTRAEHDTRLGETFIGIVLLPIVGNACEHAGAVRMAVEEKVVLGSDVVFPIACVLVTC